MRYFLFVIFLSLGAHAKISKDDSLRLRQNLKIENIREHQRALQDIADRHRGNRMAGTEGYRQSVSYIADRLRNSGYEVRLQDFYLNIAHDQSPPALGIIGTYQHSFVADVDFSSMSFSGTKEVRGALEAIDLKIPSLKPNDSTSGCESEDFAGFKPGNIALIQRGSCSFSRKAELAQAAGASAVIIFNEGSEGRLELISSRLGQNTANFPVFGASFQVGNSLRGSALRGPTGISVSVKIDVVNSAKTIQNIIAESAQGDSNRVVAVGAHLDSVASGPGINDNGSGSATILEIAELYASLSITPKNKIRFLWFGAEEFGLVGSEFYVDSLNLAERNRIMAMLNFDMLGSPNYVRFVYDGDNSGQSEISATAGPQGSALIEKIFLDYFAAQNLVSEPTAFNGRSDYGPFIKVGIPAGGLFSGAEGKKSNRLAQIYGGQASVAFDPCYHQSCDNFKGTESPLALKSLDELSQAAAHAIANLASTDQEIRPPQTLPIVVPQPVWDYQGPVLVR